ncbi:hypothetical protein ACFHYQ_24855 [Sphaerimonospora cavernae]|uniref:Uncharacterized protein n=1 Tax=Sphaerimonospora cavernae TaxID=1740611 RepID=A0ABV6UBI8_9ACTN
MPKLNKVIAGLALSTALAGGALATSATAASATTAPTEWGGAGAYGYGGYGDSDLDDITWNIYVAGHCGTFCGWDGWY